MEKKKYESPRIEIISLDNEISLALASEPPVGPGEPGFVRSLAPEYFNNNPFHTNMG
jgi:hypothetical protein